MVHRNSVLHCTLELTKPWKHQTPKERECKTFREGNGDRCRHLHGLTRWRGCWQREEKQVVRVWRPRWPAMAIRKRRRSPSSHHHNAILLDDHPHSTSYSSWKYVLLVAAVAAIILLVFTVSQRRQSATSTCHLCVEGDGTVRKFRDGDGGLQQPLVHADMRGYASEGDAAAGVAAAAAEEGHSHICPRLYHEKQTTPLQLMHALNNLMQVLSFLFLSLDVFKARIANLHS